MKITILRDPRHREFLQANRKDPVTLKIFVAGDRVTLCAACLLPFLEESWRAIGGSHCGQSATVGVEAFSPRDKTAQENQFAASEDVSPKDAAAPLDTAQNGSRASLQSSPITLGKVPITLRQS
jgi:hypothetical protein